MSKSKSKSTSSKFDSLASIQRLEDEACRDLTKINNLATLLEIYETSASIAVALTAGRAVHRVLLKYYNAQMYRVLKTNAKSTESTAPAASTASSKKGAAANGGSTTSATTGTVDPREKLAAFLYEKFLSFARISLKFLQSSELEVQKVVLDLLLSWVQREVNEGIRVSSAEASNVLGVGLLYYIISYLLSSDGRTHAVIEYMRSTYLEKFGDLALFVFRNATNILRRHREILDSRAIASSSSGKKSHSERSNSVSATSEASTIEQRTSVFVFPDPVEDEYIISENSFSLIQKVPMTIMAAMVEDEIAGTMFFEPSMESAVDSSTGAVSADLASAWKEFFTRVCDKSTRSKTFSDFWEMFLRVPIHSGVYKRILLQFHKQILPFILHPVKFVDFLIESYNQGGVVAVLALHALFTLITQYNVDYPHFYEKLYQFIEPKIFHVKYRSRFFQLCYLFLTSTYLPSYMLSAFLKKFARLSLLAPPSGVMFVIPMIYNLLKRHPICMSMIHRHVRNRAAADQPVRDLKAIFSKYQETLTADENGPVGDRAAADAKAGDSVPGSAAAKKEAEDILALVEAYCHEDLYLPNDASADDVMLVSAMDRHDRTAWFDRKAIASSLWEVPALERHYYPSASHLGQVFRQEFRPHFEYDMEIFSQFTYADLIQDELKRSYRVVKEKSAKKTGKKPESAGTKAEKEKHALLGGDGDSDGENDAAADADDTEAILGREDGDDDDVSTGSVVHRKRVTIPAPLAIRRPKRICCRDEPGFSGWSF